MSTVYSFPSSLATPPPRRLVNRLQGSVHTHQAADSLRSADAALGRPDPTVQPHRYYELAEQAIGQLDPIRRAVAERVGALALLAGVDAIERAAPHDRERVALHVFRHAVERFQGRLRGEGQ